MNRFWRNTRLEKHRPDDILEVDDKGGKKEGEEKPLKKDEPPATPKGKVKCEFCETVISAESGEYASLSSRAKHLRDLEEQNKKLTAENAALAAKIAELEKAKSPTEGRPKWGFSKKNK